MSASSVEKIASSLASVANNTSSVSLLILGAGRGGIALLSALRDYDWINIHAIADLDTHALAFPLARQLGIHTSNKPDQVLQTFNGDIVIDVTGDSTIQTKLASLFISRKIEYISGKSARLVFDLASKQIKHHKTIHNQNARLDLLDSMLAITTQLESHPPLVDIMHTSLINLQTSLHAKHGLVITFNDDGLGEIAHSFGSQPKTSELHVCNEVQTACQSMNHHHRFKYLSSPINDQELAYNLILPLSDEDKTFAALLLHIDHEPDREQRTSLNMSSIHLNTAAKILRQYNQLESMAINDGLTGLYNRRYFDKKLTEEVNRIKRSKFSTLSCAFIDIDDFKHVNDHFGHQIGDTVLKEIANRISHCTRDYDTCARYGGDEFVIILPADTLSGQHIEQVGMRILKSIAEIRIDACPDLRVSISIGMATKSAEMLNAEGLLKLADLAVYQAKAAGKNCLRIHSDEQFHYSPEDT